MPALDGILRSHIQFQGDVASYVFAGSEPGLMKQLFERKEAPLYGSAVPVRLGRLRDEDIAAYVADRFRTERAQRGGGANPLLASAKGHPQRAMLLAHRLWAEVEKGETAGLDEWERAHAAALAELNPSSTRSGAASTPREQKTMRAIIPGEGSPYRAAVLERLELTKTWRRRRCHASARRPEIELVRPKPAVVDPLFAEWIERLSAPRPSATSSRPAPAPGRR